MLAPNQDSVSECSDVSNLTKHQYRSHADDPMLPSNENGHYDNMKVLRFRNTSNPIGLKNL
jgi:hypothetical protein